MKIGMSESPEFHKLIDLGTDLEKAVRSAEEKLHYIFLFHEDGELIVEAFYSNPYDINPEMVGGLVGAINGFAGGVKEGDTRQIILHKVKFIFTSVDEVLLIIAYDSDLDDDLASSIMNSVTDSYSLSYKHEKRISEEQTVDTMVCTALYKMFLVIDDEILPEYKLGKKTVLDLELVEYEASKHIQDLFELYKEAEEKSIEAEKSVDETQSTSSEESVLIDFDDEEKSEVLDDILSHTDPEGDTMIATIMQMENLLDQMIERFDSLIGLTVLRIHPTLGFETIEKGDLTPEVFEKLQETVLDSMNVIYSLLSGNIEERILELDNYYMFLQKVSDSSFMYLIFNDKSSIELIQPIIERVANTIAAIYPD